MNRVKVYDADGKLTESYTKLQNKDSERWNQNVRIKFLNRNGYYIKGQVTHKGVKIK